LVGCVPQNRIRPRAQPAEVDSAVGRAEELARRGCYLALREALQIWESLYRRPEMKKKIAARLATTALLLAAREKELGMAGAFSLDRAKTVIKENPHLRPYEVCAEIADAFWVQGKGILRDIVFRSVPREAEAQLLMAEENLFLKAKEDEFFAYMYALRKCAGSSAFGVLAEDKKDNLEELWPLFPDSSLLKYKKAICRGEEENLLEELVAAEPLFFEAEYFLGNAALSRGLLLEAEKHFMKAFEGIPESSQVAISLASIAFAFEELERSLEFYEKTLVLAPDYRDALLGKAICLSYLGRNQEAIAVCEKLLDLGFWLIGESYYWLAWNQHELKDNEAAALNIEQAKNRLPTSTEVFMLSGLVALERGDLAKAERDLKEALEYNGANYEALLHLGILYARREDWAKSGTYFETAGRVLESAERVLREKIAEVEKSGLPPERKERWVKKKNYQLEKTRLTKATAFYNSAAGYFNAGKKLAAKEMAKRAAEHPSLKPKAEELVSGIK